MSLFNVDLRRESVKAVQAFGTMLGERVNKAAWKTYLPALIDLVIAADRGDETAADKVDALLADGITMNDLIALGAACKVFGVTGSDQVYNVVLKLSRAAQNDAEFVDRMHGAIGGYQKAMGFARSSVYDNECGIGAPCEEDAEEARRGIALAAEDARCVLKSLVDATEKLSKTKQLSIMRTYAEMACNIIECTGCDVEFGDMSDYRTKFQAEVAAEMEAAKVPAHVIEAYKAQAAARNIADDALEDSATDGWQNV